MSLTGIPSVITTQRRRPASAASRIASAANGGGTKTALAPLPVSPDRVRALVGSLRGAAVLDGVRGTTPADLDAVCNVVQRIADLALALGDELESLEVNPLRVDGSVVEALDAVVTWRDASGDRVPEEQG